MLTSRKNSCMPRSTPPTYIGSANIMTCIMPNPATASRLRAVRRSSSASCSAGSPASGWGRKPTCSSTRSRSPSFTWPGSHTMRARAVAGLTLTSSTPRCRCSALSASQLQAEQRRPSSSTVIERAPSGSRSRQPFDEVGPVVGRPAVGARRFVRARRGLVTVRVVIVEAGAGDEFGDGLAAVTADGPLVRVDARVDATPAGMGRRNGSKLLAGAADQDCWWCGPRRRP